VRQPVCVAVEYCRAWSTRFLQVGQAAKLCWHSCISLLTYWALRFHCCKSVRKRYGVDKKHSLGIKNTDSTYDHIKGCIANGISHDRGHPAKAPVWISLKGTLGKGFGYQTILFAWGLSAANAPPSARPFVPVWHFGKAQACSLTFLKFSSSCLMRSSSEP